jgi:hypothetical protein
MSIPQTIRRWLETVFIVAMSHRRWKGLSTKTKHTKGLRLSSESGQYRGQSWQQKGEADSLWIISSPAKVDFDLNLKDLRHSITSNRVRFGALQACFGFCRGRLSLAITLVFYSLS